MKDTFKYITNERKSFHVTNISEAYDIENYLINNNVAIIDPPYSVVVDFMNDRKIANRSRAYFSTKESFEKILIIADDVLKSGLDNLVSKGEIQC